MIHFNRHSLKGALLSSLKTQLWLECVTWLGFNLPLFNSDSSQKCSSTNLPLLSLFSSTKHHQTEVYQFAEVEAHKQRLRNQQFEARRQQHFLDGTTKQEKQENSAQDLKQNQQQLILILFSAIVYKTIFGTNYRFFLMFVRENFVPN